VWKKRERERDREREREWRKELREEINRLGGEKIERRDNVNGALFTLAIRA